MQSASTLLVMHHTPVTIASCTAVDHLVCRTAQCVPNATAGSVTSQQRNVGVGRRLPVGQLQRWAGAHVLQPLSRYSQ